MKKIDAQALFEKLHRIFSDIPRSALLSSDFQTVFLKYQMLADVGSLPQSADVAHKYLQIQDGDIVLTNDPYSGGTLLTSPTLILGVGTRQLKGGTPAEYFVASRAVALVPKVGSHKTIDDEGLRIPPSPYYIKGELNAPILEALRSHPQISKEFINGIQREAEKLLTLRDKLKKLIAGGDLDLSKSTVKSYLQLTEKEFLRRLDELGEGSASVSLDISADETIKLKVDHIDGRFTFDFNGTTPGKTLFLTDSTTIGACVATTVSLLGIDMPMNSGVFGRFDVKTPRGSLVNSTFPRPAFLGQTDGNDVIACLVTRAFSLIHKKQAWASSGISHCCYRIAFRDGKTYFDALPSGVGAREGKAGASALFLWWRLELPLLYSVEDVESKFPLQVLMSGFRANSGGDGLSLGGQGSVRTLKFLEDAELSWAHVAPPHKPEGLNGGKSALGPEMIVLRADGEKEELASSGALKLHKGDILTVMSPGGGGYGAKPAT